MNPDRLIATLKRHEGKITDTRGRHILYLDNAEPPRQTIGYGRNLSDTGITEAEAAHLLANDIQVAVDGARSAVPGFDGLDDIRQEALVNMVFNLGAPRFRRFVKMLLAIAAQDWPQAAAEALDSRWARQVGQRAQEIAYMLRTGQPLPEAV